MEAKINGHTVCTSSGLEVSIDGKEYWAAWMMNDDPSDYRKYLTLLSLDGSYPPIPRALGIRGAHVIHITPEIAKLICDNIGVFDDPFCHETNRHGITMVTLPCQYEEDI